MINAGSEGYGVALYNNKVVIPCSTEQYRDFVTTLNTMYKEGLISQDFFTVDETTTRAYIAEGNCGVMADWAPFLSSPDTFDEWISVKPLTSKYQPTAKTAQAKDYGTGSVFASATTKYPELVCRFFDYLYTPDGFTSFTAGPAIGQSDAVEGVWEIIQDDAGKWIKSCPLVNDGTYKSEYEMRYQIGAIAQHICGNGRDSSKGAEIITGHAPDLLIDMTNPDTFYRSTVEEAFKGKLTKDSLPPVYMDEATSNREVDLRTVIQNYVKQETAKFITGTRPLGELDAYYAELDKLGIKDYAQIYTDSYSGFVATIQ